MRFLLIIITNLISLSSLILLSLPFCLGSSNVLHYNFLFTTDLDEIRYKFTTCGASGERGPTFNMCMKYYSSINSSIVRDDLLFSFEPDIYEGTQGFRVPKTALYNITMAGAAGGRGLCNYLSGFGFVQKFNVELSPAHDMQILVGQRGKGPCDVNSSHTLCHSALNLSLVNGREACNATWWRSLSNIEFGNDIYSSVGGGGGGGASMIRLRNTNNGELTMLPLAISGGGGGSPALYTLEVGLNMMEYKSFLNAKGNNCDPVHSPSISMQGYMNSTSPIAGAGGGLFRSMHFISDSNGGYLCEELKFAIGGLDCVREWEHPFQGANGGFGGGGGGCGGGGGGGGFTGGAVLDGTNDTPGGGGYSWIDNSRSKAVEVDRVWNDGDGYVEIVPADCGCAFTCSVYAEDDQFDCTCPEGTNSTPDEMDCFRCELSS